MITDIWYFTEQAEDTPLDGLLVEREPKMPNIKVSVILKIKSLHCGV